MKLRELMEKRAKVIADARTILDRAQGEQRDLFEEQSQAYDGLIAEAGKLADTIKREEQQRELERSVAAVDADESQRQGEGDGRETRDQAALAFDGFRAWLRNGPGAERNDPDAFAQFRSLSAGVDTEGGYLVAPELFVNQLIKEMDDLVYFRGWATTQQVAGAESLGNLDEPGC